MMNNPQEEMPFDELVTKLTINAELIHRDTGGKRVRGYTWKVTIPEMKFEAYTRNLTKTLATEIGIIEECNEELILGEIAWQKDKSKAWETTHGIKDHDADQRRRLAKKNYNPDFGPVYDSRYNPDFTDPNAF